MATCFHVLGIDQTLDYANPASQPVSTNHGNAKPIQELM